MAPRTPARLDPCPCGRTGGLGQTLTFGVCCGPYLDGARPAPDAESLMRSRYTAFVLRRPDHLLDSWDPAHRPDRLDLDSALTWTGLSVLDVRPTGPRSAEVEFVAHYRRGGSAGRLHERSRFRRVRGIWLYVDGTQR